MGRASPEMALWELTQWGRVGSPAFILVLGAGGRPLRSRCPTPVGSGTPSTRR